MNGEAGGVLFAGPAGVGKTRLAVECLGFAAERGYRTAQVRANRSSATIPYGAFAALLPPATSRESESRGDLLRYFAEAILDHPDDRPLLLVVDDAHDLDDASAALLLHLVLHGSVFPVVTLRTGEPAPESVVMLWKDELLERIEVSPLTVADIAMLAADVLGGPVDGTTVHTLRTTSEGNVLFLRELIISAVASGSLTDVRGIWRLQGSLAASARLTELVRMRLGTLDDAERDALEVVSVGEPVALSTIGALADPACIERSKPAPSSASKPRAGRGRCAWPTRCTARCCGPSCRPAVTSGSAACSPTPSRARASCRRRMRCGWRCGGSRAATPSTRTS
jgi:AAA ATPase domain